MNIFTVSDNPVVAAQMLCDKHVVKMISESLQLLSNCFDKDSPLKHTHYNHPCSIWARSSRQNFEWLLAHGMALCDEYTRRYDKTHAYDLKYVWVAENYSSLPFASEAKTENPQCFGDYAEKCFTPHDPVTAYRKYYILAKSYFAKWKLGNVPEWYKQGCTL